MIEDKLKEFENLVYAATPGEWVVWPDDGDKHDPDEYLNMAGTLLCIPKVGKLNAMNDYRFISASRTMVPKLIKALRVATETLSQYGYKFYGAQNYQLDEDTDAARALKEIEKILEEE